MWRSAVVHPSSRKVNQKQVAFSFRLCIFLFLQAPIVYILIFIWNWQSSLTWGESISDWQMFWLCCSGNAPSGAPLISGQCCTYPYFWSLSACLGKCQLPRPRCKAKCGTPSTESKQGCFRVTFWVSGTVYFSSFVIKQDAAVTKGRIRGYSGDLIAEDRCAYQNTHAHTHMCTCVHTHTFLLQLPFKKQK